MSTEKEKGESGAGVSGSEPMPWVPPLRVEPFFPFFLVDATGRAIAAGASTGGPSSKDAMDAIASRLNEREELVRERDALRVALAEEREACARVAEEHLEHMDFEDPQDHHEPPYRCNVAQAIRNRGLAQVSR